MKMRFSLYILLWLFLAGCGATATPTAPPVPTLSTSTPPEQATPTILIVTPIVETPTRVAPEQTSTLEPTTTPQPTSTPTSAMQITIVSDGQPTAVPSPSSCQPPSNWVLYTVRANDTLSSLAQRTGTSWQQIQAANCLSSTVIFAGQTLYLPFIPAPIPTVPGPTVVILTPVPPGPGDPKLSISPASGPAGTTFVIGMDDFPRNQTITLEITFADTGESILKRELSPNSDGDATLLYISPQDAQLGSYNVYADSVFEDSVVEKTGEFQISSP